MLHPLFIIAIPIGIMVWIWLDARRIKRAMKYAEHNANQLGN